MRTLRALLGLGLAAALAAPPSLAHVPLRSASGATLHWAGGAIPVPFVINASGSADVPGNASEDAAIRLGFRVWEAIPGSSIAFAETTDPAQRARTDFQADDIHLVLFDETNASGFFPGASGIVAITPISFFVSSGVIADADIVFNGNDHTFATDLSPGDFDVQAIATHEIGHLLGLDHNGIGGSTMAPFATEGVANQRSLHEDDAAGAEATYPSVSKGEIAGTVRRASNAAPVSGAHVWARRTSDGRVATGTATASNGDYVITGLDAGDYRVVAEPFDGPVQSGNLSLAVSQTIETDFEPAQLAGAVTVTGSSTSNAPDLLVDADVTINVSGPPLPQLLHQGDVGEVFTLAGSGLTGASASFPDTPASTLSITGTIAVAGAIQLTVTVGAAAPPGVYDLRVTGSTGDVAFLPGYVEVLAPPPDATSVAPTCASTGGGTSLTVGGTGFLAGAEVVLGDVIGTATAVPNATTITTTAPARAAGSVDLVVIAADGQEDRLPGAILYGAGVSIDSVFPAVGSTAGGTTATILGSGFVNGCAVTIGGACGVTFVDSTRLEVVLPGNGLGGSPFDVVVTNPGGGSCGTGTLFGAFTVVSGSDPTITSVTPASGPNAGATAVTIIGSGFTPGATVRFGADLADGTGGALATVTLVTPNQIDLLAPPGPSGPTSLLITNTTGQVARLAGGYTYLPLLQLSDRLDGAISPAGDVDAALIEGLNGTLLSLKAAATSGSLLQPKLVVRSSAGAVLLSTDPADAEFDPLFAFPAGTKVAVKAFPLPGSLGGSDMITVEVSGMAGTSGTYTLKPKEKLPKSQLSIKIPTLPPTMVGPESADFSFAAKRNSRFTGKATVAAPGLGVEVAEFLGPSGSILSDPAVSGAIVTGLNDVFVQLVSAPLSAFGGYTISIGPTTGAGPIKGSFKVKPPKSKLVLSDE
ncbi:MAG: IPT/TIG domain-containing protein [Planctomycetes bacterium]|nr:IPT/TIG domain-containing protein [Planctomycetota bacterium]